jgi:antirestriction protein
MVKFIESKEVKSRYIEFEANATRYTITYSPGVMFGGTLIADAGGRWAALVKSHFLFNYHPEICAEVFSSEFPAQSKIDWTNIVTAIQQDAAVRRETDIEKLLKELAAQEYANGVDSIAQFVKDMVEKQDTMTVEEIAQDIHEAYFDEMQNCLERGILLGRKQARGGK